jgi:hypothetical protein
MPRGAAECKSESSVDDDKISMQEKCLALNGVLYGTYLFICEISSHSRCANGLGYTRAGQNQVDFRNLGHFVLIL